MLFVQFRFIVFFLIVFAVHWALRGNRARKAWLLACSHFFYACLFLGGPDSAASDVFPAYTFWEKLTTGQPLPRGWWFPVVMVASTTLDYFAGLRLAVTEAARARRFWVALSVIVNLGVLAGFKYFDFFISSASGFLGWLGLPASDWTLRIFLPAGISFYTFQSMSYSIDVYRRRLEPIRSYLDLSFYIAFFPQLVAGPIVRALTFLPQVGVARVWARVDVRACLTLFFIGFVKKACISENVAPIVDAFFQNPAKYEVAAAFTAVLYYAVQIYCDFSGYTDMALACAGLLGYELTINFNYPYFAANITEFWRRWHISLSTWLRDYLYIPLGGSRGSKLFTYRNLMLTMLLGGLWHGASWTFVIWGGLHGLALIVHREYSRLSAKLPAAYHRVMAWLAPVLCFYWVCITYIFFRSRDVWNDAGELRRSGFEVASTVLKQFTTLRSDGERSFDSGCLWFFAGLAAVHWLASRGVFATWWRRIPDWAYAAVLGVGVAVALAFKPLVYKAFIYFAF